MTDQTSVSLAPVDLDEAQRLCDAASPGEWEPDCIYEGEEAGEWGASEACWWVRGPKYVEADEFCYLTKGDAHFQAASRTLLPRVIAELRECRTQRDENLANVRRIDDLRIAETARLQRELDAAQAEVERLKEQVGDWHAYLRWRAEQDSAAEGTGEGA